MKEKLTGMINQMVQSYRDDANYDHVAYKSNGITGITEAAWVLKVRMSGANVKATIIDAVVNATKDTADLDAVISIAADTMIAMQS